MVDTCHGDSGGPLACQVRHPNLPPHHHNHILFQTADGTYKLVGIVNWGGGYCGEVHHFAKIISETSQLTVKLKIVDQAGKPGVYTRVQYYDKWIQEMMGGQAGNVLVA